MAEAEAGPSRGAFIVLEGLDRSGKSTQVQKLVEYLKSRGVEAEAWRFPDRTTAMGKMIASYLDSKSELDDCAVHLLFSANRWEKRSLMEAKLREGTTLIVDRYSYSGVAFTAAKGLPFDWCKAPEVGLPAPDAVLYLQIPPEAALERGGYGEERYEKLDFQRVVASKYEQLRDATWQDIDARKGPDEVQAVLRPIVDRMVQTCKQGRPLSRLWP
ncbi:Thymidylate kinase/adenylate kinase [Klebsormidium nitens]|uniref:Thymidylate kinase n=1 Tax=Klebsormidium nitens TaxID=105231 RepID=A0A1Y1ICV4_KLENI|nr:Thymidylate kinase/adenylate kinase [Klebsormidium nitens]|eukprot:GAQ88740.1 Thymidylate kinase/adenylate kinase [Klebsormidium nitens]